MLPVAILAGGLGTRLQPLTEAIPKALVEVRGEPFLGHQLRLLRHNGIVRVVLCLGHLGEQIEQFAGDGKRFDLNIEYSWDASRGSSVLLGTAGAVRKALPLLGEAFFVLYGDSYLPCSYASVQQAFEASGKAALMTVFHNEGRWDSSNVEFAGGRILAYNKHQPNTRMRHIDYGLGVFRSEAFSRYGEADLAALYQALLRNGELAGHEVFERFYEIGSHAGLEELGKRIGAVD